MIKIVCAKDLENKDLLLEEMCETWNEVVNLEGFYKPFTKDEYKEKMLTNPHFDYDVIYLAYDEKELIGFIIGIIKNGCKGNPNMSGYINAIVVKEKYRKHGVGDTLLKTLEDKFVSLGHKSIMAYNFLPACYGWYIPEFGKHDHPCAPGIRVNSKEYMFLLHHGYECGVFQDAFHLNLSDYEYPARVEEIKRENAKDGIVIELYDPNKHYGLEEFYADIKAPDFESVIRENLALEKPYPFLVVSDHGKVVGWTGAFWNEASGRGHFDGIIISESVRGRGLGKALFSSLAYYSKQNGAGFMTFYTGLNNHARYIYMGAGFKIVQTFVLMKKTIK